MKDIIKYIENGISISGNPANGYEIFTIPTQHFRVSSLEELTPELFKKQIEILNNKTHFENELLNMVLK